MQHQQPYDNSIKSILKDDAAEILPYLLPGAQLIRELDIEVLQAPMRADRVYLIRYKGKEHILHLEFQASEDSNMAHRLLVYHANILEKHKRYPIITVVIYLFDASIPKSPLREVSGEEEILTFHFRVLALWKQDARKYVQEHAVSMYSLLPAMEHADSHLLLQVIDEMLQYYRDDEAKLQERLLWLSIFLRRTETMLLEEKEKVIERLDAFEQLLEEDEFVQKQRALGKAEGITEGKAEGIAEGKAQALKEILVDIVKTRYPSQVALAQDTVAKTQGAETLHKLIHTILTAPDEATAHFILDSFRAT